MSVKSGCETAWQQARNRRMGIREKEYQNNAIFIEEVISTSTRFRPSGRRSPFRGTLTPLHKEHTISTLSRLWLEANFAFHDYRGPRRKRAGTFGLPGMSQDDASMRQHNTGLLRHSWTVLAAALLADMVASPVGSTFPSISTFFESDLGITKAQVGYLVSAEHTGAVLVVLLAGWLSDIWGFRWLTFGSLAAMGILLVAVMGAGSYGLLLGLVFLVGLASGFVSPAMFKGIAMWFRGRSLATAMSIKESGGALGGIILSTSLPIIALAAGWRVALATAGVSVLCIALLVVVFFKDPGKETAHRSRTAGARRNPLRVILAKDILLAALTGTLVLAIYGAGLTYFTLYATETLNYSKVLAGMLLSLAFAGSLVGRLGWGVVSDRFASGNRKGVLFTICTLATLCSAAFAVLPSNTPPLVVGPLVAVFGLAVAGISGVFWAFLI